MSKVTASTPARKRGSKPVAKNPTTEVVARRDINEVIQEEVKKRAAALKSLESTGLAGDARRVADAIETARGECAAFVLKHTPRRIARTLRISQTEYVGCRRLGEPTFQRCFESHRDEIASLATLLSVFADIVDGFADDIKYRDPATWE